MSFASFLKDIRFNDAKPQVDLVLETTFTKEIRLVFQKNQLLKKHQTSFPIIVQILRGHILFGVENDTHAMRKGDVITLEGGVPHDLKAIEESIVRLTLSKTDTAERVKNIH